MWSYTRAAAKIQVEEGEGKREKKKYLMKISSTVKRSE